MGYTDNIMSNQQSNFKQKVLFTKLYENCEKQTLKHIKLILQKMFDNADDTLFALAEKTNSTTDSTAYFDSMRIIRLKRSEIENQHFDYIKKAFTDLKNKKTEQDTNESLDTLSIDDLSLIEDADLEENIAIKNIVNKVSHHCAQDLRSIEKRLSHIIDYEVSETNNPLGPNVIANTFMKSASSLDIELKVSLIILKLFDQEIVSGISSLLHEANNLFINANVLPEFKHTIKKSEHLDNPYINSVDQQDHSIVDPNQTNYAQPNSVQGQPHLMAGQQINTNQMATGQMSTGQMSSAQLNSGQINNNATTGFNSGQDTSIGHFHQLLTQQNAQQPSINNAAMASNIHSFSDAQTGNGSTNTIASQPNGQIVSTPQFIGSLTQLQNVPISSSQQSASVVTNDNGDSVENTPSQAPVNLKEFVIHKLQQQDDNFSVNQINQVDQDVIDVVSMLFEFILEDKNIPDAAKAHIARLQIPLLKAAIIDKEFFSTNKNSARSLLNALAHAALGIIDENDSSSQNLLTEIKRIVDTINDNFDDDLSLFNQQLELFNDFLAQHIHQEDNINHKIKKKIKQKEDHALAYHWVEDTIDEILTDKHLPEIVVELINGPWKKVMLNTYLNNGQNSDLWKNQVRFIDVLEWSIQPKHESIDRQKLAKIIGQLVMTLRNGLQVIQVSDNEIKNILSQLEPFHLASVKGISVKEHLATLTPHESFLFAKPENDEKISAEIIPITSKSSSISKDEESHSISNLDEDEAQEQVEASDDKNESGEIPKLETNSIIVEDVEYEADENYESNLSLEEIDKTIIAMEEELLSLDLLSESINQDISQDISSTSIENESDQPDSFTKSDQPDSFTKMEDDFSLLGDNDDMAEDNFSKLITEDIILSGYSTEQNDTPEDQPQDEYLELARHLEQGKWVEFLDDNQNKTRAKLAWKSELLGEYTFLNWKFDVVADKTLYGLAADLRRGSATIIDDLPLVDRALSAVMSSLTPTGTSNQAG